MLIPYAVDVPLDRRPFINWLLIASIVAVFLYMVFLFFTGNLARGANPSVWVLTGWDLRGLIGHMWLHAGPIHLVGNMLFLWIFGNAVCSKVGNALYFPLFLAFGLFAAATHLIFDGRVAVGASGAINGVVGMYLVFFPLNNISCLWWYYAYSRTFDISGFWMIGLWFVFDIFGAAVGIGHVAYYGHLGGFALGVVLGFALLSVKVVKMSEDERSIICIVREHRQKRLEDRLAAEARQDLMEAKQAESEQRRAKRVEAIKRQAAAQKQQTAASTQSQVIHFSCTCGQHLKMPRSYAGRTGMCPACKKTLIIPQA